MKNFRSRIYIVVVIVVIIFVFSGNYKNALDDISSKGISVNEDLQGRIKPSIEFIDTMTVYGNNYFKSVDDSYSDRHYGMLRYDENLDGFSLSSPEPDGYREYTGSITGLGKIPEGGDKKKEINLALSFNEYFSKLYNEIPDAAWIYYTSKNDFIYIYPWISPDNFRFSNKIQSLPFFNDVAPEVNPNRNLVWTPVYMDAAGKGLMVTLSGPVYNGNNFTGAVSIDFTTKGLSKMINCRYKGFLIDADNNVIAAGQNEKIDGAVHRISEFTDFSMQDILKIRSMTNNSLKPINGNYVFKAAVKGTPWLILFTVPVHIIFLKALEATLPVAVICMLSLLLLKETINIKMTEEKIRKLAITDPLTGLGNRYYLDLVVENEIKISDRYGQPFSIISMDIDYFKNINDTYGHPIGDEVLKQTAEVIKNCIRKSDIIVRLGGEEFMILLPQTNLKGAYEVAEKIRRAIEKSRHYIAGECTASFGVAERQPNESYHDLYKRADAALYLAKSKGRNNVVCHNKESAFSFLHDRIFE